MDNKTIEAILIAFDKPPEEAVAYLKTQGIEVNWDWRKQKEIIQRHAFTISKVLSADILQTVLDNLNKSIKDGDAFEDFQNNLEPKLADAGFTRKADGSAWRLQTIFQTNMQSAYNAGRYTQQQEVAGDFPYWELDAIIDKNTTEGCRDVNGVILPANDPFWKINYPPRHFNCRSKVVAHNEDTLKMQDKSVSDPDKYKDVKPAEGFDTLPGEWQPDLGKYDKSIADKLKETLNE